MSYPTLTPLSQTSAIVLPITGNISLVPLQLPFGVYSTDADFLTGAVDQVSFTYKMLGGDVLDIELTEYNVYSAYETAVLEYSYILNLHQAKNVLPSVLGNATASFDSDGEVKSGTSITTKYPSFDIGYVKQISTRASEEANVGGNLQHYKAYIDVVEGQQDYNIQEIVYNQSLDVSSSFYGLVEGKKLSVRKVYYKTPRAMWRFYGYYGGLNSVGNLSTYGQYTDDSTFEVVPAWQNKLQAMNYEDNIHTRISHYSYDIRNNILRLFPYPEAEISKFWIEFTIPGNSYDDAITGSAPINSQKNGINNMNTVPLANIPYGNINSIGKQWIRRYALAVAKEMLGQVRSKFSTVPIPGESINLNGGDLLSQAKDEQNALKDELKTILADLTYDKLAEMTAGMSENATKVLEKFPLNIFVG
jgi:hypothetical protein